MRRHDAILAVVGGLLLSLSAAVAGYAAPATAPAVEAAVVAPAMAAQQYVVSPKGVHLAAVSAQGSRAVVLLDGVPGPAVDEVVPFFPVVDRFPTVSQTRVAFSADGKRHAYVGRVGQEYVVFADGKEVLRAPVAVAAQLALQFFGPGGEHLYFTDNHGRDLYELWVDGKRQPGTFLQTARPAVTPDGGRFAYVLTPAEDRARTSLIVDGKPAGYAAEDPQFTGDGRHVAAVARTAADAALLVDGKPVARGQQVAKVYVAPAGDRVAAVLARPTPKGAEYFVVVDGREVPGTASVAPPVVAFSPDGKRYAARCGGGPGSVQWVVADGTKGREYRGIDDATLRFSPDSTKLAYVGGGGSGGAFLVVNGQESAAFDMIQGIWFSPDGKRMAYGGMQGSAAGKPTKLLVVDGAEAFRGDPNLNFPTFAFGPDSARWALGEAGGTTEGRPVIDGKPLAGFRGNQVVFGRDGKTTLLRGQRVADGVLGLFADGQLLHPYSRGPVNRVLLSPDAKHAYWDATEQPKEGGRPVRVVYADGVAVARYDNIALGMFGDEGWEVGADGPLTFLAPVSGQVKRFRVTPAADASVASAAAAVQAAAAQAQADAAKAKADADKAKADAMAAKAKADADAQAAREQARADAVKRRQEAAAAAAKAKADAAAARAAKQKPKN